MNMNNTTTIVMLGSGCMDEYYEMDYVPELGEKVCCRSLGSKVGGMVGNAAAVASSYGMNTYLMDTVNRGRDARKVLENFEESGVKLDLVRYDEALPDVKCLIFLNRGERIIYVIPTEKKNLVPDEEQMNRLKAADYVYTNLGELKCFLKPQQVIDDFRKYGTKLVLDVEYLEDKEKEEEWNLIKKADVRFVNSEGDRQLKEKISWEYKRMLREDSMVVLTEGDKGCSVYERGEKTFHIPAYPVVPVDTTGAGDTFNVSFLYALSKGMDKREAGKFANAAAARSIQFMGPRSGAAGEEAVLDFIKHWKGEE